MVRRSAVRSKKRRSVRRRTLFRPALESLESRQLMAANLQVTGFDFVDANSNPITSPAIGEQVFIRANWTTTDLTASDFYRVQVKFDSTTLSSGSFTGSPGTAVAGSTILGNWWGMPGQHRIEVFVDSSNNITESNESDNKIVGTWSPVAPTTLPSKFLFPIQGTQNVDWMVDSYVDMGNGTDYQQGIYANFGSRGLEIVLKNFAQMDAGVPVRAVAEGIVTSVQDGRFDRETFGFGTGNFVEINHGDGWVTRYLNLLENSTTLRVGQAVTAGQILGLVGSSGASTNAQLTFQVFHNGGVVETYADPPSYWFEPVAYQGELAPTLLDKGVTSVDLSQSFGDLRERPVDVNVLHPSFSKTLSFWYHATIIPSGSLYQVVFYHPDGTRDPGPLQLAFFPMINEYSYETFARNWALNPGTWQAALEIDGVEVGGRASFKIESNPLLPEIRLSDANGVILDDRTTPIDFGTTSVGQSPVTQTFSVQNISTGVLHLSNLRVPNGYSLVGSFPTLINPGASANLVLRLDATVPGEKFGEIRFTTDDIDNPTFNFNVLGTVFGAGVAGTPILNLPSPTTVYVFESAPQIIDPNASVADTDTNNFKNGSLTVAIESGASSGDRLAIINSGSFFGQIGVSGTNITYSGATIGTMAGGTNGQPLVISFTQDTSRAAVEALMRNITFDNTLPIPAVRPRYITYSLLDETLKRSNTPVQMIVLGSNVLNTVPSINSISANPTIVSKPDPISLAANLVTDSDGIVKNVAFYLESNNIDGWQQGAGGDQLISTDTTASDGWTATLSTASLAVGTHRVYAIATDDRLGTSPAVSVSVTVNPTNQPPEIIFVTSNPTQVIQPNSATFSASGVSDPDGTIAQVNFYIETNGISGLQTGTGGDTFVASDVNQAGGYTANFSSASYFDGTYNIYAQAVDNLGAVSAPVSTSLVIGVPPPAGAVFELNQLQAQNGGDGTRGTIFEGAAVGDQAGTDVAFVGDVNGDGYDDMIIGAPLADIGTPTRDSAGVAYVVFGGPNFGATVSLGLLNGSNGYAILGANALDGVGRKVTGIGDINGDGFADIAVGYPENSSDRGILYVIYGKASGYNATLDLQSFSSVNGFSIRGIANGDRLLQAKAGGDINGDGIADFLVGATGQDFAGPPSITDAGAVYAIFGKKTGFSTNLDLTTIDGTNGFRISGVLANESLGAEFGAAGDFNGDGLGDILIGSAYADTGNPVRIHSGAAYVVFGHTGTHSASFNLNTLNGTNGIRINGDVASDFLGITAAAAGDVNGDGIGDLVIGAQDGPSGVAQGKVYVVYGKTTWSNGSFDVGPLAASSGAILVTSTFQAGLGAQVAGVGDVNGDGLSDILVSVWRIDLVNPFRAAAGESYLIYGKAGGLDPSINVNTLDGITGFRISGIAAGDRAGESLDGRGDVNGDGFDEMFIGARSALNARGQTYLVLGRDFRNQATAVGDGSANLLSGSVAPDIIVGGRGDDTLHGNGGVDSLKGGLGNDLLTVADGTFRHVHGGAGTDTLQLAGHGITLNLVKEAGTRFLKIEQFDIRGDGDNTLTLSYLALTRLQPDGNQFVVMRDVGDTVTTGGGWTLTDLRLVNGELYNVYSQGGLTLFVTTVPGGSQWQNPNNALDVNFDGSVSPADALAIINYLNAHVGQNQPLPSPALPPQAPPPLGTLPFWDPSGDGYVTALDALLIINYLNGAAGSLGGSSGEGEGESVVLNEVTSNDFTPFAPIPTSLLPATTPVSASLLSPERGVPPRLPDYLLLASKVENAQPHVDQTPSKSDLSRDLDAAINDLAADVAAEWRK